MRRILFLHPSAGRYGADRQLGLLATGLDRGRFEPIVVLAEDGPLRADLEAAGVEVHVRPLAVLRRSLMSPTGMARVAAAFAADAGGLGRLARTRGVAVVHTNTSVTLGGAAAARIAGAPHVWHVREIYAGFERWWPAYRRLLLTADALPCVSAAAAAGRCVVVAAHGGLPEIVRDGETGVLVEPGDPAALAAALGALDRATVERLGAAAAAEVPRRFSPAALVEGVQGLYDELVEARGA